MPPQTELYRTARTRYGSMLYNPHDIYIGRSLERYGEYSGLELNLFHQFLRPGDVAVDAGAHIGVHSLAFARLVGPEGMVHAFEPQPALFQLLCANLALNSLTNARCHPMALGAAPGTVRVPPIRYDLDGNFGGLSPAQFDQGEKVALATLDQTLELERLRLIKVDVEGMEQEVLAGAAKLIARYRPVLYVENDRLDQSPGLIGFIMSLGYRLFWHCPPLFNPDNFAGCGEDIFPGIVSANMLCLPAEASFSINGFQEIRDPHQHPMADAQRRLPASAS